MQQMTILADLNIFVYFYFKILVFFEMYDFLLVYTSGSQTVWSQDLFTFLKVNEDPPKRCFFIWFGLHIDSHLLGFLHFHFAILEEEFIKYYQKKNCSVFLKTCSEYVLARSIFKC